MKRFIFTSFLLQYVLCSNFITDHDRNQIYSQLNELSKNWDESKENFHLNVKVQEVHPDDIALNIYTKKNPAGTEIHLTDANRITDVSPFNLKLETIFYIHGWLDTIEDEGSTIIKNALLESANVNIIIVNWDKCATSIDYFVSQRCVPDVGKYLGEFVETVAETYGYSLSDITVVGHSLGAHIAGHIGKYTNGTLGTIVGLDPAGPFYFKDIRSARLTEDDARYVQAIHTDALFLGVNFQIGNADFWPNGGFTQNGCGLDAKCSHINSYKYYAESITNNAFFARKCDSYSDFTDGKCDQNSKTLMAGIKVDTSVTGDYYLSTNSKSPFGKGDV